ncbi:MAG TPA: S8 family serine peptidase [Solirubrobacterales bacterium]|nr:S8 family serine peptidase [Solirubrobacterales bacterium]
MRVLVQLRSSARARAALTRAQPAAALAGGIERATAAFELDATYEPVQIPAPRAAEEGGNRYDLAQPLGFSFQADAVTHVVRGSIPDGELPEAINTLTANPEVVGVFSDPVIESCICPQRAIGTYRNVANVLDVGWLHRKRMDGRNVLLAIVDTGINKAQLVARGQDPQFDRRKSWAPPHVPKSPGNYPVNHGTMCAFDAGISAPKTTFLDYALLLTQAHGPTQMSGLLSDGVAAYGKLLRMIRNAPVARRRLVVSNSWGMFSPSWDFPVGSPGNYSDNPSHPFNVIVASLEAEGADILFAAGNCGRECPDSRCAFGANQRPICGANSHPKVLSIGGIDYRKRRIGYSSQGPGRLAAQKPDVCTCTAFTGSHVYPGGDSGTSAACPVAAGVVAAVRSKYSSARISPAKLRALVHKTAEDLGGAGYDYDYGWGALSPRPLAEALAKA